MQDSATPLSTDSSTNSDTTTPTNSSMLSRKQLRSSTLPPTIRRLTSELLPEDILGDSSIFQLPRPPFWKRKRFHFIVGVTVGLLATYGASTTPTANDLQSYLALQLAEMDLSSRMLPAGVVMDDLFGNFTSFFNPTNSTVNTEETFMPAWGAR
jgi:phospholipid:diacylglycerol acyltransferase